MSYTNAAMERDLPASGEVRDFIALLKPRVMSLVVFSGLAGLLVAPGSIHPVLGAVAVFCIAVGAGASGAINMWYDRDIDAVMTRTRGRPIPMGKMPPAEALSFGVVLAVFAVALMGLAVNWAAAALLAVATLFYVFVYTMWLKRRTPQNIVIGGAAGAFPPMIGWTAVTGDVTIEPILLFALIFFWTPPHFWALSLVAHKEYEKAGVPMLPVTNGAKSTRLHILLYTILLAPIGLAPLATGLGGWLYGGVGALLTVAFLYFAVKVFRSQAGEAEAGDPERKLAMSMFAFSILYLFGLFAALIVEHGFGLYYPLGGI